MKISRLGLALFSLFSLVSPVLLAPGPARAADVPHLRVLPLGDSITVGVGGSGGGYRLPLWNAIRGQSAFTMEFVGTQRSGPVPDPRHEGHSSYLIDGISGQIDNWMATAAPDVVLLHIGINDLDRSDDKEHAPDRLAALVSRIFADRPGVTVVLGGLLATSPRLADAVAGYNAAARRIVADLAANGDRIRYVNFAVTSGQMADELHPADAGYAVMGETFRVALERVVADGGVTSSPAPAGSASEITSRVRWADFDGDGRDDYWLLVDGGPVQVWLNRGDGTWTGLGEVALGLTADRSRVRIADFDGDRRADYLLFSTTGAVTVYLNRGGDGYGGWSNLGKVAVGVTTDAGRVRLADFDGDAKADYLLLTASGAVQAWLNRGGDGHGGWSSLGQVASGTTTDPGQVRFARAGGDARADYLRVNRIGSVDAWINEGGSWAGPQRITEGSIME
ncbi:FG-GAP-like repeat-containing protein [Actinoplanes sichuanensis]|uniref:FG-GAP-like repeat-containing protein n=1 Tax=Actinoplanes sichuanensis TaxID=512349 RepID=A0ABW4AD01_9ACTN|nr:FG-GAP-like repeat-containing protein [Actinoplanes sichuanensis]